MTRTEAYQMMEELKRTFDIVRLVDVAKSAQYSINSNGDILTENSKCFAVWHRNGRCENCISSRVFAQKTQMTKFEFIDNEMYFIASKYIEIDDKPYIVEMVSDIKDDVFLGAFGKEGLSHQLSDYSWKLSTDELTGFRNRTYYDEQIAVLDKVSAVAVIELYMTETEEDVCGRSLNDEFVRGAADKIRSCIEGQDAITAVRYEDYKFLLVFSETTYDVFEKCLKQIHRDIEKCSVYFSDSIGGYFAKTSPDAALEKAEEFLIKAKKSSSYVMIGEG